MSGSRNRDSKKEFDSTTPTENKNNIKYSTTININTAVANGNDSLAIIIPANRNIDPSVTHNAEYGDDYSQDRTMPKSTTADLMDKLDLIDKLHSSSATNNTSHSQKKGSVSSTTINIDCSKPIRMPPIEEIHPSALRLAESLISMFDHNNDKQQVKSAENKPSRTHK